MIVWYVLKNTLLINAVLLSVITNAYAETIEDGRAWLNLTLTGALPAENWRWYAELQPRLREEGSHLDQVLLRPAIYYNLTKQSSVWAGYAHVITHPAGKSAFDEHRLWQQYLYQFSPVGDLAIQSRTRVEQRFIENSDDTGYKLRQMFRVMMPSGIDSRLSWVLYDEYFINLNQTDYGAQKGFDQNRAFVGANWTITPQAKFEFGYLNQHVKTKHADLVNHVLSSTFNFSF